MVKYFREDLHRKLLSPDFKKQIDGLELLQKVFFIDYVCPPQMEYSGFQLDVILCLGAFTVFWAFIEMNITCWCPCRQFFLRWRRLLRFWTLYFAGVLFASLNQTQHVFSRWKSLFATEVILSESLSLLLACWHVTFLCRSLIFFSILWMHWEMMSIVLRIMKQAS